MRRWQLCRRPPRALLPACCPDAAASRVRDADLPLMIGSGHAPAAQMDFLSFRGCALVTPSGALYTPPTICLPAALTPARAGFCGVLPHFIALTVIDLGMCEQVPSSRHRPLLCRVSFAQIYM